ncbi:hypothetical protein BJ508DRAFT_410391 [Ascobolus immersus RN42]|uniref:Uncharacterized protein n=1 Tax=Ascobolus immersus RN42 TaxID=1160509 RepID=A0A3N4INB1_ASCIM|nr:hypothetical protein BJ508DRAFT_410391 [Ascobolus immersus RN42]
MASSPPSYVYVVVISTDERKTGGTEMVDTCGVFETAEDANEEAKSLLSEQYDGHLDAGFIERWTDDDSNTITYDDAGCLRMFDYPEEVCTKGLLSPFKVTVNIHEVRRSRKTATGGEGGAEEQLKTPMKEGESTPTAGNTVLTPPASTEAPTKKRSIDDVDDASEPPSKRPQISLPPISSLMKAGTPNLPHIDSVTKPDMSQLPSLNFAAKPGTPQFSSASSSTGSNNPQLPHIDSLANPAASTTPPKSFKALTTPAVFEKVTLYELTTTTSVEYGQMSSYGPEGSMEDSETEVFLHKDNAIAAFREAATEDDDERGYSGYGGHGDDDGEGEEDDFDWDKDGLPSKYFEDDYNGASRNLAVTKKSYTVIFRPKAEGKDKKGYAEVVQKLHVNDWDGSMKQYVREVKPKGSIGGTTPSAKKAEKSEELTGSPQAPIALD